MRRESTGERRLGSARGRFTFARWRAGLLWPEWLAGLLGASAALPAVWMPLLSDDWAHIRSVRRGLPVETAFSYFRPLYTALFKVEGLAFGAEAPAWRHVAGVILSALAAVLVVRLARRFGLDEWTAAAAGALFAIHPYHVEAVAWVSARADPLFTVPYLAALLLYDRWRAPRVAGTDGTGARGARSPLPIAAMAAFELALLAKETAGTLPVLLIALGMIVPSRRPDAREWKTGLLPLCLLDALHFLLLRPIALAGAGRTRLESFGLDWLQHAGGFAVAAVAPADVRWIAHDRLLWGLAAAVAIAALLAAGGAWRRDVARPVAAGGVVFLVTLLPSLVGFQEGHFFLSSAASAFVIALLLTSARPLPRVLLAVALFGGWSVALVGEWSRWYEASAASRTMLAGLLDTARRPEVSEIIVANGPREVAGGSIEGDYSTAIELLAGRRIPVRVAASMFYSHAGEDALEGPEGVAVTPEMAVVRLSPGRGPFQGLAATRGAGAARGSTSWGSVAVEEAGRRVVVRIHRDDARGRAALLWRAGRPEVVFLPAAPVGPAAP